MTMTKMKLSPSVALQKCGRNKLTQITPSANLKKEAPTYLNNHLFLIITDF